MAKSSFKDVLAKASKDYDLKIGPLSSVADPVEAFTTGNLAIDHVIGVGGLPRGRSVELFGPPSSGKTTTALQTAAHLQRDIIQSGREEYILYMDYEQALDPVYAKALGLDVDHDSFLLSQPDDFEQGANLARKLIETGQVPLSIWDSAAAMTPSAALEAETGKASVALQARLFSDFLKQMNPLLRQTRSCAVFLNHVMEVLDMGGRRPGMPPRTSTPGGRALKFYGSVRVEYQQVKNIKAKTLDALTNEEIDQVGATNVRVRVIKNKVASPFKQCEVRVRFGKGFDNGFTALQVLVGHKKVVRSGAYYYFDKVPELVTDDMSTQQGGNKRPYVQGEQGIISFMDDHPDWCDLLVKMAREVVSEVGVDSIVSDGSDDLAEIDTTEDQIDAMIAESTPVKIVGSSD